MLRDMKKNADDGKLSAQWEHMILVTEDGVEILSK